MSGYKKPIVLKGKQAIPRNAKVIDTLLISCEELYKVRNPQFAKMPFKHLSAWKQFRAEMDVRERWIYWPSDNTAVRMLDEELYFELRTARNRNLITKEEQDAFRNCRVGIAGLSVGSSVLSALVLSGGPKFLKLADFDTLETTNINRIRAGVADIGSQKIDIAAREVWRVDPFAQLKLYPKGLSEDTMQEFMVAPPRLDIFIDEMDNLSLKVASRIAARRERIPGLLATDYGDSALIDIERFDLEPKRPIFHGLAGNLTVGSLRKVKGPAYMQVVEKIIGGSYMPERNLASMREVGKTLAGMAQLGTDAISAGAMLTLVVRQIAAGESVPSGRYLFNMRKTLAKSLLR